MADKTFDLSVLFRMVDRFSAPMKQAMHNFNKFYDSARKMDSVHKRFGANLTQIGSKMRSIGTTASMTLAAPIALMGVGAVKAAMDLETAFAGVEKTVEASPEQFKKLRSELEKLSTIMPMAATDLMGIAEAAGQTGIAKENLIAFTTTMAHLANTTDLKGEEAVKILARFAKVAKVDPSDFERLGSTIVGLGNKAAASENEILNMARYMSGTAAVSGFTAHQILGMSAAMVDVGISAEAGGSAMSKVIDQIQKSVAKGDKRLKLFAKTAGMSAKDFKKSWKMDPARTVIKFTEGLAKHGDRMVLVLDKLKLDALRTGDTLKRAAGAGDSFRLMLQLSETTWRENKAMIEEANKRYKTFASQLDMTKQRVTLLSAAFGMELTPRLTKMMEHLNPVLESLAKLSPDTKVLIMSVLGLAAAIALLLIPFASLVGLIGLIVAFPGVALALGGITAAAMAMGAAVYYLIEALENLDQIKEKVSSFFKMKWGDFKNAFPEFFGKDNELKSTRPKGDIERRLSLEPQQSKTDINIKVSTDQNSSAKIEGVKSQGGANINVIHDIFLGNPAMMFGGI